MAKCSCNIDMNKCSGLAFTSEPEDKCTSNVSDTEPTYGLSQYSRDAVVTKPPKQGKKKKKSKNWSTVIQFNVFIQRQITPCTSHYIII
jgi:hypothetical protein